MHPILFKIPVPFIEHELPVRSFGMLVMLGVIVGAWWLGRALRRLQLGNTETVSDLTTVAVLAGLLGARWLYLAIHPDSWRGPISLIALWDGGIVSFGGFVGGALGVIWLARRKRLPLPSLADTMLPALFLGQVFGRIGCFLVGDDYGAPWDGPWAVAFPKPEGGLIPDELVGVPLHPSQLYLSALNLVIFVTGAAVLARRRFAGQAAVVVLALYGVGRFLIEFTRGDDVARGIYGPLSTGQWLSLATLALAGVLWVRLSARQPQPADVVLRTAGAP